MNIEMTKPPSAEEFTKEFHRFQTHNKAQAFSLMQALQEKEPFRNVDGKVKKTLWRVSANFCDRIAFDIDSHDEKNMKFVSNFYGKLFDTSFVSIRTVHGYHLVSKKKYTSGLDWVCDTCRVLMPSLEKINMREYLLKIETFYAERKKERDAQGELSRSRLQELTHDFEEKFRKSGLFEGAGDFEILFAVNVIMRGFYSLRISKKNKNDNPEEVV